MHTVRSLPPLPRGLAPWWLLPGFFGVLVVIMPAGASLWMQGEANHLSGVSPLGVALWLLLRVVALYVLVVVPLHESMHWLVARSRGYRPRFTIVLYGRFHFPCAAVDSGALITARDLCAINLAPQLLSVVAIVVAIVVAHMSPTTAGVLLCATAFNFGTANRDLQLACFAASHDSDAIVDIDRGEVAELIMEEA